MIVTYKGNSAGDLNKKVLNKVNFPEIGVIDGERSGILSGYFKDRSKQRVTYIVKQFKGSCCIMAGVTTHVFHSLEWLLNNIFKANYCCLCD